jgi:hypothetical protein
VTAARHTPRLYTLEDLRIRRPFDLKESDSALLQPAEAMIDEDIGPWHLRLEFDNRRPPYCTRLREVREISGLSPDSWNSASCVLGSFPI